jgi:hypothetical protein
LKKQKNLNFHTFKPTKLLLFSSLRIKVCSSIGFYVQQLCVCGGGRRTKRIIGAVAIVLAMMLIVYVLKLPIGFTENVID